MRPVLELKNVAIDAFELRNAYVHGKSLDTAWLSDPNGHIRHAGIKPNVIAIWIKNHGHAVVDGRGHGIRDRGQDRTRLEPLPVRVSPPIPQSSECELLPVIDLETVWLLGFPCPRPLVKPVRAGIRHLRDFKASRNAGFVSAVSDRALIMPAAPEGSFAHDGISPQRISENCRIGSFGFWRITGTGCVGAMLNRGLQSSSLETLEKYSPTICFRRESL
jgi:hypothetical protein